MSTEIGGAEEATMRLSALGVRVRFVPRLEEGCILFRDRKLVIVDDAMDNGSVESILNDVADEVVTRNTLRELEAELASRQDS